MNPGKNLVVETREQRAAHFQREAVLMEQLSHGQKPTILYIGCSDSRVMPSRVLGAKPGDVFVLRNIANVVPPAEANEDTVGAVIEYAVLHLHVAHIIICGHALCGGIQSLIFPHDDGEPALSRWLDFARPARQQISPTIKGPARLDATIERNVLLQVENLKTYPCVQSALQKDELTLHAWVYDFRTGRVRAYDAIVDMFVEETAFGET